MLHWSVCFKGWNVFIFSLLQTDKTFYVLRGMAKYSEYRIRVEAVGPNGPGLSSDSVTVRTFSDIPSGSPTNVRLLLNVFLYSSRHVL